MDPTQGLSPRYNEPEFFQPLTFPQNPTTLPIAQQHHPREYHAGNQPGGRTMQYRVRHATNRPSSRIPNEADSHTQSFESLTEFGKEMMEKMWRSNKFKEHMQNMHLYRNLPVEDLRKREKDFEKEFIYPHCYVELSQYSKNRYDPPPPGHAQNVVDRLYKLEEQHLTVRPTMPEAHKPEPEKKSIWKMAGMTKLKNAFHPSKKKAAEQLHRQAVLHSHYVLKPSAASNYSTPRASTSNARAQFAVNVDPLHMDALLQRLPSLFHRHGNRLSAVIVTSPAEQHKRTSSVIFEFPSTEGAQEVSQEITNQLVETMPPGARWGIPPAGSLPKGASNIKVGGYSEYRDLRTPDGQRFSRNQVCARQISETIGKCLAKYRYDYHACFQHFSIELEDILIRSKHRPDSPGLLAV